MGGGTGSASHVANDGKTIEEFETDNERQLLAGEGAHQRFEHAWKPGRFQTPEPMRQFSQPTIPTRRPGTTQTDRSAIRAAVRRWIRLGVYPTASGVTASG